MSQNIAPVVEYRCLWTYDLRRKIKRWQDGYLKFHAFNKRIMVYDQSRNYIGDRHNDEGGTDGLDEGDEIMLERGGAIVQIQERIATAQTDLSELLAKRVAKPIQPSEAIARRPLPTRRPLQNSTNVTARVQTSTLSPFEQRQLAAQDDSFRGHRPTKRRRVEDGDHVSLPEILARQKLDVMPIPVASQSRVDIHLPINQTSPLRHRTKQQLSVHRQGSRSKATHSNFEKSKIADRIYAGFGISSIPSSPPVSTRNHLPALAEPATREREERQDPKQIQGEDVPKRPLQLRARNSRRRRLLCQDFTEQTDPAPLPPPMASSESSKSQFNDKNVPKTRISKGALDSSTPKQQMPLVSPPFPQITEAPLPQSSIDNVPIVNSSILGVERRMCKGREQDMQQPPYPPDTISDKEKVVPQKPPLPLPRDAAVIGRDNSEAQQSQTPPAGIPRPSSKKGRSIDQHGEEALKLAAAFTAASKGLGSGEKLTTEKVVPEAETQEDMDAEKAAVNDDNEPFIDESGPWTIEAFDLFGWYPPNWPGQGWAKYETDNK